MKCVALFAVLLLSVILVQDADSWRIRVRCRWYCPRACSVVYYRGRLQVRCRISCRFSCSGKKKREVNDGSHVTPLPCYFDYYDMDENDLVSQDEFEAALGSLGNNTGLTQAFNMTDTDQDKSLTEQELFSSTCLVFENQGSCSTDVPE